MKEINYVEGDLFEQIEGKPGTIIIAHVCNDLGVFGAGFVVPLGRHFPEARDEYLKWSKSKNSVQPFMLGETQVVFTGKGSFEKRFICNMVAQRGVGGVRPLRYNALIKCMETVATLAVDHDIPIHAPMFGSKLAGGDWNLIEKLIEDCWLQRNITVTINYLPGRIPSNWTLPTPT